MFRQTQPNNRIHIINIEKPPHPNPKTPDYKKETNNPNMRSNKQLYNEQKNGILFFFFFGKQKEYCLRNQKPPIITGCRIYILFKKSKKQGGNKMKSPTAKYNLEGTFGKKKKGIRRNQIDFMMDINQYKINYENVKYKKMIKDHI